MGIVQNKEIYDPGQGNPFSSLDKYLEELDKSIVTTTKLINDLQGAIKSVNSTAGGKGAKTLTENIEKLNTATETLNKQNETRTKINDQIKKSEKQLVDLYEDEAQQLSEVKLELQERRAEMKKTAKENKVAKDSLTGLNIELSKLRKKYDELSKAQRNDAKVGGALLNNIQALDEETKQLSDSTGRHQKKVGNYPKIFGGAGLSLKSFGGELKSMGSQLLGAGSIIGALTLLVNGAKAFVKVASEIITISKTLQGSFDITKEEAKATAAQIRSLAGVFDQDYNQVIKAATAVSKELDISVQEATDRIQEGFLKGSNTGGEFLDILQEYPAQFRAAGIDAETTFAIINQVSKEGLYSDKGIDAIKEGGLRLRENTKAVQEALAPLEESTRLQIQQEIAAGRSFEAIKLVSSALNDTSLTAEETQKIIADVFGGAGEDAGIRYLKTLKDIDSTLDDVDIQASINEQSNLGLSNSWNNFVSKFANSESIFVKVWATIKDAAATFFDAITFALEGIGLIGEETEKTAKKLQSSQERRDSANKIAAQKRAEELNKQAAQDLIDEEARKIRFEAWKKRQAEIDANNTKELSQLNARVALRDKEIEAIDRKAAKEEEEQLRFIENLEEEEEIVVEFQDVALAREEQFESDKLKIQKDFADKSDAIIIDSLELAGEAIGELFAGSEKGFKQFSKSIVLIFLATAEKLILLSLAELTAKQIASKGFAGIATSAILGGIVKGTFSVIKAQVSNFAEGTESVQGPGTETSDSIPAMLSKNERVVPARINKLLGNISNEDLPALLNANYQANDNSRIEKELNKSNELNQKMVDLLTNSVDSYINNGVLYIIKKDGSGIDKIIQNG